MTRAYEEIIDFIAAGASPRDVVLFQPSEAAKARVADLIHREKTAGLLSEETTELNHYMQLEHVMRLAKARARAYLADEPLIPHRCDYRARFTASERS
jgi:hypothetical protein